MLSQTADLAGCSSEADSAAQPKKRAETFSGFEHKDKEPSGFHSYLLTHMFTVYLLTRFRSFKTIEITLIIISNSLLSVSPALCPYPHLYPSSHSLSSNPSLSLPPLPSPLCPSPLPIPFPSVHLPTVSGRKCYLQVHYSLSCQRKGCNVFKVADQLSDLQNQWDVNEFGMQDSPFHILAFTYNSLLAEIGY